ncbi:MAG: Lrp/AsnC family transcriptional regulator [Promethearchaeota archaeon]|jgi:DNA-binding Lrp family transcriptional regulator
MPLDKIDKQILKALFNNGRESLSSLSKTITKSNEDTMSHAGIAKRISKLEDSGTLKVQGNVSVKNLNYYIVFILMEMKNFEEVQKISEAYSECPRVFLLAHVTGQYNLIFGIVGQDLDVLRRYINFCGPTNKTGVLHSAIIFTSELITPKFVPVDLFSDISKEHKCENICKACQAYLDGKCQGCGNF